jgi:hypothetical protein
MGVFAGRLFGPRRPPRCRFRAPPAEFGKDEMHLTNTRSQYVKVRLTNNRSGCVVVRLTNWSANWSNCA